MKKLALRAAVVTLPLLLTAGGVYAWGVQEPAVAETHERAVALFNAMETYSGTTAVERSREATRYPGVSVVVARDTSDGQEIVLAITATSDHRDNFDWWPTTGSEYSATRCYRWTEDRAWDTADEVECPAERDVVAPPAPQTEPVGPEVDGRVAKALTRGGDAASVRAALAGVDGAVVEDIGDTVAVAVTGIREYTNGIPVRDCVLGYRTGQTVRVWRPSALQVAPGEASCDPAGSLDPALQRPPH